MFSTFFINRPIFASVLSIVVTLAGGIAVWALPVAQYPEITPPTVEVSAIYPGANARVVADKSIPKMCAVRFSTVLRLIAARVPAPSGAVFVARAGAVELTT